MPGPGLYANIHAKRKRGGKMRKKGDKGAPKASDFAAAKRTAKDKGGPVKKRGGLGKAIKEIGKRKAANERAKKRRNDLLRPGISASPDNPIEVKKGGRIKKKMKRGGRAK
jgi:hypothetical protein